MDDPAGQPGQRIDRWLWYARFLKSRSLAAALVQTGRLRINGQRISKASRTIRPGDVLTFPLGPHIRVVKVLEPGTRRGPAPEAALLYEDLDPPQQPVAKAARKAAPEVRNPGSGRPTKKEGRQTVAWKNSGEA
ncbi:RNA-binding S4 domain-containing protein [Parvibaculum sp.]|uniref:RNA-binding S4 domain-containing protein n=1 Tax=Parvibaculum sp. TaxID=2024848 RepID=UPI0027315D2E|nr:RNA-binding S4 domain-containing protein [Parvibaculum sp.]MDP1625658.1 RNA-binding S4 domain-containing protein [Parvibaculum sp.]MDP2149021.1 RNA-binding S4 domain-containing protein [Parvibaculum sp.]MDP3328639.1 RNA-binding S4 domain-containing protein [Parvibaculum sp.]